LKSPGSNLGAKRLAAERAAELVEDGMTVGLGSGSTSELFVRALGERIADGLRINGVASSRRTEAVAAEVGLPLVDLTAPIDLAVDGADAIERGTLNAVKGLGGALTREKLVALAAHRFILVGDRSKLVDRLADRQTTLPVPVEVLAFGWKLTSKRLETLGGPILRERDGKPLITDNGNLILDLYLPPLDRPADLSAALHAIPGVVEHGLFLNLASLAIVAGPEHVEVLTVQARAQQPA
jgi:ribose 5-phosphate isomerase A